VSYGRISHAPKTVGEIHYVTHGKADPEFDTAVMWLGKRLGVLEIDRSGGWR
jgi:hypothetical protein